MKALADLGWLHPAKGPFPRRITDDPTARKAQLAKLRGVRPDQVTLADVADDVAEPDEIEGEPEQRTADSLIDLKAEARRITGSVSMRLRSRVFYEEHKTPVRPRLSSSARLRILVQHMGIHSAKGFYVTIPLLITN